MIDFIDEVPHDNDILYHITETVDTQGNKAYRIELATEVTSGTPMNKVLFDSIKTDLEGLENSKQDKAVTGTFTWNASSNTTVNLGFKPRMVIAISDSVHLGASNQINRTALLCDSYGIMIEGGATNADTAFFTNTFNSNGFTVKPLNTIASTSTIQNTSSRYIAFK